MASLFKPRIVRYVDADGRRVTKDDPGTRRIVKRSRKWYGRYIDADGIQQRKPLCTDKAAAQAMLAELVKAAELQAAGLSNPFAEHRKRSLAEHFADYRRHLEAKANTAEHIETTLARSIAICDGCGFRLLADLDAGKVAVWLADARRFGVSPETMPTAAGVARSYADIAKHFGVAERTVTYWRREGAPIKPRGKNDLAAIAC